MTDGLRLEVRHHLAEIEQPRWDGLADGSSFYSSYGWLRAVERQVAGDAAYVTIWRDHELLAALPTYRVRYEPYEFYSAERYRQLFGSPDREFLFLGGYRGYRNSILLTPTSLPERDLLVRELVDAALRIGEQTPGTVLIFPYLTPGGKELLRGLRDSEFVLDGVEAELVVGSGGLDGYVDRLTSDRRHKVRRELRRFAEARWRVTHEDLHGCIDEAAVILANIQNKYGHGASPNAMRRLLTTQIDGVGDGHVVIGIRDAAGELAGMSLCYFWRDHLYVRMVGFDYERLRAADEYFNLAFYEPIRLMESRRLRCLHLGPATLDAKVRRGALLHPLWAGRIGPPHPPPGAPVAQIRELLEGVTLRDANVVTDEWTAIDELELPTSR